MKTDIFIRYSSYSLIMVSILDKKDKKILYELDLDSRQPLTKIAKKVQLSRESILYRIKKYQNEGIIRDYLTVIDMAKLGFIHHKIYIKLHNITEEQEKKFIQSLGKNPNISWISSCDGKYSLIFGTTTKSVIELNNLMKEIDNKYWKFIKEKDISAIIDASHFDRSYLVEKENSSERKAYWGGKSEKVKLDDINFEILNELSKNSRVSSVEIAEKLKISPDAVIQRIKGLERSKVVINYMVWPNVNKLTGLYYKVLVTLHSMNKEKENRLKSYCLQNPNIVYMVNSFGQWQLELDIEVENMEQFRDLMRKFLNRFSDVVSDYSPLNIFEEYKFRFFENNIV
ncbi:HTH-type transcriptional regulator LrpC [archaeon BMS3Abin17]|nr:HTH-type transcriptional regulator LrpC [archaeon BMS3Abin17]HDZ60226.1 Lrp/AsnC family transcriptional regulator [Candidatus Pacearchaeota archaeon]